MAIVVLSFVGYGNTLWGFQFAWYLVLLALSVALALCDQSLCADRQRRPVDTHTFLGSEELLQAGRDHGPRGQAHPRLAIGLGVNRPPPVHERERFTFSTRTSTGGVLTDRPPESSTVASIA